MSVLREAVCVAVVCGLSVVSGLVVELAQLGPLFVCQVLRHAVMLTAG